MAPILLTFLINIEHTGQSSLGPNAMRPSQPKFWVGHGSPCSAPILHFSKHAAAHGLNVCCFCITVQKVYVLHLSPPEHQQLMHPITHSQNASASSVFVPSPLQGLCPWTRLGDFHPPGPLTIIMPSSTAQILTTPLSLPSYRYSNT